MDNYLLFKQIICLLLFFEALIVLPRFGRYFGKGAFPNTLFTNSFRIYVFHAILLSSLTFLFFDACGLAASFILVMCMRYLYIEDRAERLTTFGALGFLCYLIPGYIFFFETSFWIDPSNGLAEFIHSLLAIQLGVIMMAAGLYKGILGYFNEQGFEFGLVNPSWGKFFFLFKKIKPSSYFFKMNNYAAFYVELLCGVLFLIPVTRELAAYLLLTIFIYIFLTIRVNIMPLLMMSLSLLFIKQIPFHFPVFHEVLATSTQEAIPSTSQHFLILGIEFVSVLFMSFYILMTAYRMLEIYIYRFHPDKTSMLSGILVKYIRKYILFFRPFEWTVFTHEVTRYYIKIEKISKKNSKVIEIVYDGFSKGFKEVLESPSHFFRYIHHNESSFLNGGVFLGFSIKDKERAKQYQARHFDKIVMYGKTVLPKDERENAALVFTVMEITKTKDQFLFKPYMVYLVDVDTGTVIPRPI